METQRDRKLRAQVRELRDANYCPTCQRIVKPGEEHDPEPHLSLPEQAAALKAWRDKLPETRTSTRKERDLRAKATVERMIMKITQEQKDDFEHRARQYYVRCAEDALPLAPLPEFKDALAELKLYDQNLESREELMRTLRTLKTGLGDPRRAYGYTAVGCFYSGLLHIISASLMASGKVSSCSSFQFEEAFYCAARDARIQTANVLDQLPEKASRAASDRYWKIYNELFPQKETA